MDKSNLMQVVDDVKAHYKDSKGSPMSATQLVVERLLRAIKKDVNELRKDFLTISDLDIVISEIDKALEVLGK